ncbi:MAG: dihydroxy-acid dehydratase [Candidatus Lokiarchaeota archaeon]|nr:dihydroxy-acid dehydratase [Candidatus Lokiarchaeota archaeon]
MDQENRVKKRSSQIFSVIKQTPFYFFPVGIIQATGYSEKELNTKPLVGVANSYSEINPGHMHLNWLAEAVKLGVIEAGGIPFIFNTVAPCDGFANGHEGMKFILPQREIIADSVEAMVEAHRLDALVTISSCDKINPAMLMAAARLDIPTVCVPGGPGMFEMELGPQPSYKGIENRFYDDWQDKLNCISCATYGACSLLGTANTTQCLMEAFGMTLPNAATIPAMSIAKQQMAKEAGRRTVELLKEDLRPSKIMTKDALENALAVDVAIGGSTNSAIHLPAIAHEIGIDFDLEWFNDFSKKIPTLCNISPSGQYSVVDLYRAGGIPAVMSSIKEWLHLDAMTVSGKPLGKLLKKAAVRDDRVIMPLDKPLFPEGGTVVLKGNLAPRGAVCKQSGIVHENMRVFSGPAVVFDSEGDAITAAAGGAVPDGSVIVVRYQGPKGAPGMPELLALTATLMTRKDLNNIALITDARFSGASVGPVIGHVAPEAFAGGPLAALEDGDTIKIDVPGRRLDVDLADDVIRARMKEWRPPSAEVTSKLLQKYRALVTSADRGCVHEVPGRP